ncbi:MAG: hypothetical protein JO165_07150 [Candidatus Eremiobacteraeota bacterium]|nr:hypothetical protein [Candidatus Eremiobacteraeota bacterium]
MIRLARVALAVALITVLPSALSARPQAPAVSLNYRKIFDLDQTHGNFILAALQPQSYASLITAAVFGRDVPLPLALQAPVAPLTAPNVRLAQLQPVDIVPPHLAGMLVRLHSSHLQIQYMYDNAPSGSAQTGSTLVSNAIADFGPSSYTSDSAPSSTPVSSLRTNSSADGTQSYSFATPSELATPAEYAPYVSSAQQGLSAQVTLPVRVGPVHFAGRVEGAQQQTDFPSALDAQSVRSTERQYAAGTNFNVGNGPRSVNVDVSSTVEHLDPTGAAVPWAPDAKSISSAAKSSLAAGEVPLVFYPNVTDVTRRGYNASVAVPVNPHLTVTAQYNTQHYLGSADSVVDPTFDARKDAYTGKVTYEFPHSNSALTLSARTYNFIDNIIPAYNQKQTRTDVNFTVKF